MESSPKILKENCSTEEWAVFILLLLQTKEKRDWRDYLISFLSFILCGLEHPEGPSSGALSRYLRSNFWNLEDLPCANVSALTPPWPAASRGLLCSFGSAFGVPLGNIFLVNKGLHLGNAQWSWRKEVWPGGESGRSYDNLGKHGGVIPGSSALLLFCVLFVNYLWNWSPEEPRSPPPSPDLAFMPFNLTCAAAAAIFFPRWEVSLVTTHGILKAPCYERADDLHPCGRGIISPREVFTVPRELKLHDEWRGNQIDFLLLQDTAVLETVIWGGTEQKTGTETGERGEAKANATGCWEEGFTFIAKLWFCVQSPTLNRNMKRCEYFQEGGVGVTGLEGMGMSPLRRAFIEDLMDAL